jgi:hypothetical protein
MPELALTEPTPVQVIVLRADGQAAQPLSLTAVLPDPNAAKNVPTAPVPQGPQSSDAIGGPFEGFAPQNAAPVNVPVNSAPQPIQPTSLETFGNAESNSEPVSLAQAFGEGK